MNTFEAIYGRRSIRKFKTDPVSNDWIEKIIRAGIQAPSGMNRQPWRFTILQTQEKAKLLEIMSKRAQWLKKFRVNTEGYESTIKSMGQAPVIILVWNTGFQPKPVFIPFYRYLRLIDLQSIGGAIQTMLLATQDLGLGTLWICNVFYVDKQIRAFLKKREELIAAIAIGYADEQPDAKPRKDLDEVLES